MPRVNIHGGEYPIRKIFSDDFVFTIPRYQRPYAWTTEQAGELLDDLLTFMGDATDDVDDLNPYFLGSVVLIKGDGPSAEVVDGQQRLTTLTILLSALRATVGKEYANFLTPFLYEQGNPIIGTPNRYRLRQRERDADFFQQHIQDENGMAKLEAQSAALLPDARKHMRNNALLFLARLRSMEPKQCADLAKFIVQRCFLVAVSTPDLDSAYRIFSVLNDRGMNLSYTDILKADVIGKIPEAKQEHYADRWEETEEWLGRDGFQELFTHIRTIFRKVKARDTVLKEIRQYVQPAEKPLWFVDDVLTPYADAFHTVKRADYKSEKNAEPINRSLRWLGTIDNFDWIPPAVRYLSGHQHNPDALTHFFADLERLAAGLMIRRANINKRIERYGALLEAIEAGTDLYASDSPLQLTDSERDETIEQLNGNVYLHDARLYILLRLDSALAGSEAVYEYPTLSVEHVLPQNPPPGSEWVSWFPTQDLRDQWVHRIGNLVLLSRRKNSAAQNYDFARKKTTYFSMAGGVSPFAITTQVLQENAWTPQIIERRQRDLVDVLKRLWRL